MRRRLEFIASIALATQLVGCETYRAPVDDYTTGPRPAAPVVPSTQTGDYVVRRGDTLYSIAFQFGYSYQEVAAWNNIRPPYTIYVGQRLRVGPPQVPRALPPAAQTMPQTPGPQPLPNTPSAPAAPLPPSSLPPGVTPIPPPAAPTQSASAPPATAAATPVSPERGLLPDGPVQWRWPTDGRVTGRFAPDARNRRGIDIAGREGQPVRAAAGGQVVYSGSGLIGYGQLIIIKHNKSLLSAYAYNRKLLVKEGDAVRSGDAIAEMGGNPGDKPMLHFEIRVDGKPVDPLKYLPPR